MKYLSFTFDDGRDDTYYSAFDIMKKSDIPGTVYVVTGFVDGTWKKPEDGWKCADGAITIPQLMEMRDSGWEIALHGDKHKTDLDDWRRSIEKMASWGISGPYGFSLPESFEPEEEINRILNSDISDSVLYIRRGRSFNIKSFPHIVRYATYKYLKLQSGYNSLNKANLNKIPVADKSKIYSVPVRFDDRPEVIFKFIDSIPDGSALVLMFHSILPEDHPLYGVDSWNWSSKLFSEFCESAAAAASGGKIKITTTDKLAVMQNG